LRKYGHIPGGYWNIDGWKGYEYVRALYNTYIRNGEKNPEIQVNDWLQNPMADNAGDNNGQDLQSTGDGIGRL
jgi:hypothetical protein